MFFSALSIKKNESSSTCLDLFKAYSNVYETFLGIVSHVEMLAMLRDWFSFIPQLAIISHNWLFLRVTWNEMFLVFHLFQTGICYNVWPVVLQPYLFEIDIYYRDENGYIDFTCFRRRLPTWIFYLFWILQTTFNVALFSFFFFFSETKQFICYF